MNVPKKDGACVICGEPTTLPPYCIECDMTGASGAHRARHRHTAAPPPSSGEKT